MRRVAVSDSVPGSTHLDRLREVIAEHLRHRSLLVRGNVSPNRLDDRWVKPVARDIAEKVLDALQLTEEWAFEFTEPLSGDRKHYMLPESEARQHAAAASPNRNAAALSRLVGPWVVVEEDQ